MTILSHNAASIGTLFERDERNLVEKYGKQIAPFFRLGISDQSDQVLFSAEAHAYEGSYDLNGLIVSDVEFDETDCQTDMIKLTVQNIDLNLHDSRLFAEGNSIDLWMGYDGHQPDYMGRAIIVTREPDFGSDNIPTITVTAYDISYFMMEEGRNEISDEGTDWVTRNSRRAPNSRVRNFITEDTHISDTRQEAERRGDSVNMDDNGRELDAGEIPIEMYQVEEIDDPNAIETPDNRYSRSSSTRRSRRDSGKVWRELTDSEIVDAIFKSYGIVPYTEAINQRVRGSDTTRTVDETETILGNVADTESTRESYQRENERIDADANFRHPNLSVDENARELDTANHQSGAGLSQQEAYFGNITTSHQVTEHRDGRRVVQKSGTSDWDFCKMLAAKHGFIMFVFFHYPSRQWIGYWGAHQNIPQQFLYTFKYARGDETTLKRFKPIISMRGQKTEIDMTVVDPRSHREQHLRVSMDSVNNYSTEFRGPDGSSRIEEPLGNGPQVVLSIHGQRVAVSAGRNFSTPEDARIWLMSFWYRHAADFCQAEGETVIGLPEMRARQFHYVEGVGRSSGKYFITKATHKMGTGAFYTVNFSGYRIVDMLESEPNPDDQHLTIEDSELGQRNTVAPRVPWRERIL